MVNLFREISGVYHFLNEAVCISYFSKKPLSINRSKIIGIRKAGGIRDAITVNFCHQLNLINMNDVKQKLANFSFWSYVCVSCSTPHINRYSFASNTGPSFSNLKLSQYGYDSNVKLSVYGVPIYTQLYEAVQFKAKKIS